MDPESNTNPWSTPRSHSLADATNPILMVGSPPGPEFAVGSPPTNDPLHNLYNMFPQVDLNTVNSVFERSGRNPSVCAEMLLSIHPLSQSGDYCNFAEPLVVSDSGNGASIDFFRGLPFETIKMIAKFLTLFDLANFGCVNRECKRLAEEELCTITMLHNAGGMRQASDERILNMLARFPRLTTVSLYKCADFQNFALLPVALRNTQIMSLNLGFCEHLNDDDIRVIMKGLPTLQQLDLTGTYISDEALESISAFGAGRLRRLILSSCENITDFGIGFVNARCSTLEELDLKFTHIKPIALEPTTSGARLMKLVMSSCKRVSRVTFANEFASLRTLVLSSNQNMTSVVTDLPNLNALNLSTSKQLRRLVLNSPVLIVLNLSGCSRLSEAEFSVAALTRVNLYNCRSLPFNSIDSLIRGSRSHLQDVDLRALPQLMDDETAHLVSLCPAIERFDVTGCKALTPAGADVISGLVLAAISRRSRP